MKKILVIALSLCTLVISSSCNKETVVEASKLPESSRTFITTHFPNEDILQVTKDQDGFTTTYAVTLSQLTALEFFKNGRIKEIECKYPIPNAALPTELVSYVQNNYNNNSIIKWSLDNKKQDVTLNSGIELEFDKKGKFKKIDN